MKKIDVANDFSRYPAGRYAKDGPNSGQRFRDEFLIPVLKKNGEATILLDGVRGYGSSFLEEAFGGLVRAGYSRNQILDSFRLLTEDESLRIEIKQYINDAD